MKWILLAVLIILVLFFSFIRSLISSSASQAETTPTSTPTLQNPASTTVAVVNPAAPQIFYELNMAIENMENSTRFNQLEHITGASYQVTGLDFRWENNSQVLQVKTRCECVENGSCCTTARTFIVTIMAVASSYPLIVEKAGTITSMEVWCYDHANLSGVLSVPWTDLTNFFQEPTDAQGVSDGFQLWYKVTPLPAP